MKQSLLYKLILVLLTISFGSNLAAETSSQFNLEEYEGKVVYLDFWASWCVPCQKSFPWMNKIQKEYGTDKLVIIAVNLDKKRLLADNFLAEYPADFKIFYDPTGKLAKRYQIKGMPSSIIFDQSGTPVSAHTGFFKEKIQLYEQEIESLLAKERNK